MRHVAESNNNKPFLPSWLATKVQEVPVADLKAYAGNARKHPERQIIKIMRSIERFGFINPILVDPDNSVVAGHGRLVAARRLGMVAVPAIRLDHLTPAQLKAYRIADNRLAELAEWDKDVLIAEWQALQALEVSFDLTVTGFELPEIDTMIDSGAKRRRSEDRADALPDEIPGAATVTRPGDLWELGPHRLLCGDVRDRGALDRLMGDDRAAMVFTDPPYNVAIDGHVCGSGSIRHAEFAMASGEMSPREFTDFLTLTLGNLAHYSKDGAIHYVAMDWRHMGELLEAGTAVYSTLMNLCVWEKDNGGMGSFYRSRHELIFMFKHGFGAHQNNVQLGKFGRYRTNVWNYPGVNTLRAGRMDELSIHPTVKPVAMVADALLDSTSRHDIVLDGFAGSGTILLAAERTGRRARALELEPRYVDVAVRRWENFTGQAARHAVTGATFDVTGRERQAEQDDGGSPQAIA